MSGPVDSSTGPDVSGPSRSRSPRPASVATILRIRLALLAVLLAVLAAAFALPRRRGTARRKNVARNALVSVG